MPQENCGKTSRSKTHVFSQFFGFFMFSRVSFLGILGVPGLPRNSFSVLFCGVHFFIHVFDIFGKKIENEKNYEKFCEFSFVCSFARSFECFSNFSSRRRDRFSPKIVKFRAILAIFRPFQEFFYLLVWNLNWNWNWDGSWNDLRECQKLWGGSCIWY